MGLIVIDPGLSTTVQDAGRTGYREWGVPPGGAFDRGAAGLANALVGNDTDCAVLELTLLGGTYTADRDLALAMAGAPMEARVLAPDGSERILHLPLSWTLRAGERLVLGRAVEGARTYLAVRGGWQTRLRLGSRSSEERLRAGDVLPAEPGSIPTRHPGGPSWISPTAEPFRILDGPDAVPVDSGLDASTPWSDRPFRVGSQSNRMGLRLEGEADRDHLAARSALGPSGPGRRPGGRRTIDRPGGRRRDDGRLSARRPHHLGRPRPPRPAPAGRCHPVPPRDARASTPRR